MSPKAPNNARAGIPAVSQKDKDLAKQSLMLADKFLKDGDFDRARKEVDKAQKLDPSNPYTYAFLDRITYFEEEKKKKEAPLREAEEAKKKAEEEARQKEEEAKRKEGEARQKEVEARQKEEEAKRKGEEAKRKEEEEARKKREEEEARKRAAEDAKRREAEAAKKKVEEEEARKKAEEEKKRAEEEERRKDAEAAKKRAEEEAARKKAEEEEKKREAEEAKKKAEEEARLEELRRVEEEQRRKETILKIERARKKIEEQKKAEAAARNQPPKPEPPKEEPPKAPPPKAEQPAAPPPKPKAESMIEATRPVIADVLASRSKEPPTAPPIAEVLKEFSQAHASGSSKGDLDGTLDDMRRQIEMLTKALDQERKVREEMNQQQMKGAVKQLRVALEKAWLNGTPKDEQLQLLKTTAAGLGIPADVVQTLNREVKLDMYSRAVKEVVAKQNLVRNSSRTLEWLRKVYGVTLDEYLEYESKFLMDLVADQYKGTILLVSANESASKTVSSRLKSSGYAVVGAKSPEHALEKIEKINPHYILCDMVFPSGSLSGIKFLHVLRANSKFNYLPFILMCEKEEVKEIRSSELRPTEGFIEKPINMDDLNAVMGEKLMAFRQYLSSL